jgi:hypothetical protein
MNNKILVGNRRRLWCKFKDENGADKTPSTVILTVKPPVGESIVTATSLLTVGQVYADVTFNQAGTWKYRFEGSGDLVAACEGWIDVSKSQL